MSSDEVQWQSKVFGALKDAPHVFRNLAERSQVLDAAVIGRILHEVAAGVPAGC